MSDSMITYNYTVSDSRLKVLVGALGGGILVRIAGRLRCAGL